jgi:hypothetical protein
MKFAMRRSMTRNDQGLLFVAVFAAVLACATLGLAQGTGVRIDDGETTGIGDLEPGGRDVPGENRGERDEASPGAERTDPVPEFGLDHERAQREANEEREAVHFGKDPNTDPEGGVDGPGGGAGPRF